MDTYIGLIALILSVIGAWTVLRAIARGARAARTRAANVGNAVIGKVRSALRAAARVRDHRQHGHERLQGEAIAMLVNLVAELRAEIAALKSGASPVASNSSEVAELLTTRKYRS